MNEILRSQCETAASSRRIGVNRAGFLRNTRSDPAIRNRLRHPEPARADIFDLAGCERTIGRLYRAALLQPYSGLAKTGWALERHPAARQNISPPGTGSEGYRYHKTFLYIES